MKLLFRTFLLSLCFVSLSANASKVRGEVWEKFYEKDGIELFRSQARQSGVIPFKASGVFAGDFLDYVSILFNHSKKPLWSPKLKSVTIHKQIATNQFILSEYYKTPWPATDREFLLKGSIEVLAPNRVLFRGENASEVEFARADHIVCDVKILNVLVESVPADQNNVPRTRISFEFNGDMKGWMPIWLINLIQKKWPLRFLEGIREFLKNNPRQDTPEFKNFKETYLDKL